MTLAATREYQFLVEQDQHEAAVPHPRAAHDTIAITDGVGAPVRPGRGAPNLDFGGNQDEKDHLHDVGIC